MPFESCLLFPSLLLVSVGGFVSEVAIWPSVSFRDTPVCQTMNEPHTLHTAVGFLGVGSEGRPFPELYLLILCLKHSFSLRIQTMYKQCWLKTTILLMHQVSEWPSQTEAHGESQQFYIFCVYSNTNTAF